MRAPGPLPFLGTCCCSGLLPLALLKPGCFRPLWSEPAEMESISLSSVSFSLLLVKQMKILKNLNKYLSAKTYQMCVFKKKIMCLGQTVCLTIQKLVDNPHQNPWLQFPAPAPASSIQLLQSQGNDWIFAGYLGALDEAVSSARPRPLWALGSKAPPSLSLSECVCVK